MHSREGGVLMLRPVASAVVVFGTLTTGCTGLTYDSSDVGRIHNPQNDGANGSVRGVQLRNAFLLGGTEPSSSPAEMPLYAVLINEQGRPDRLQRVSIDGGETVRLTGTADLPSQRVVGGQDPIGTAPGVTGTDSVPMTFTFARAGNLRVYVPVKLKAGQYASLTPSPAPGTPTPGTPTPAAEPRTRPGPHHPAGPRSHIGRPDRPQDRTGHPAGPRDAVGPHHPSEPPRHR
jgi:hypothetical protein